MNLSRASGKAQSRLSGGWEGAGAGRRLVSATDMDVSQPVGIGSDFLGYRIEELIGRGGMGVVYRAYDLRLKRPVAVKLVAPVLARDERFRERFARESELVMSLEHPNVVPIYDAGDVDGHVYLAMRLVDGSDLGSLLRAEGALEPARAIAICKQVAAALDAAHARGLVHRDVKPSNVLLDGSEHVYLADFGLTRRLDEEEAGLGEEFAVGTPAYLAPEQLEGGPVTAGADVYSLGCVLYECLTGRPVFVRSTRLAVAWAHLEEEPPRPSLQRAGLPDAIDAVVERALAKQPERRYPTCGALITAAEEALGLATTQRSPRRRTLLAAAAAALSIAAATAVIATTLVGAGGGRAAPLLSGPNTLARIDPASKKVTASIHVSTDPVVAAGSGDRVWVYGKAHGTIDEIDARTDRVVRKTVGTSLVPPAQCCSLFSGPVLTADASGAWFVRGGIRSRPKLVHVAVNGRKRVYPLPVTPTGVTVGDGSVWVVGHRPQHDEVLRFDPTAGRVAARRLFPASSRINSIAFGFRAVWVVSSARATLYRIDPQFRHVVPAINYDVVPHSRGLRPEIIAGRVWFRVTGDGGLNRWFWPSPLAQAHNESDGPPNPVQDKWGFGTLWWTDWTKGAVFWERNINHVFGGRIHKIPVAADELFDCLTSITTAGGAVWVAVAPIFSPGDSYGGTCRR